MERGEKSSPVTFAPSRAIEMVSVPMWHCRWARRTPRTLPISATAKATSLLTKSGLATSSSTRYSESARWPATRSSQLARLASRW